MECKEMVYDEDDWAVFWCSLLGPILLDEVTAGERRRFLQHLSQQEVTLPNGHRKQLSYSTLRRKVRRFRQQKIAGLRRRRRADLGQARKQRQQMIVRAVELKRQQPRRSPRAINKFLALEFGRTIPASTINRHFRQQRVTRRQLGVDPVKIRCRWTREQSNALWLGDFADGPVVLHGGCAIKSHLSIWIDCHSRYVPDGRYYYRENFDILIDSLLRAWGGHGASRQLYVDNAKIYHARGLRLACAHLNIELLHRPPREPQPGGLVERVIQTIQHQFEAEVRAGTVLTLAELNQYFQAWLHRDYHATVHRETNQTPQARYEEGSRFRRHVNLAEVREFFSMRERRKVDAEFSDVRVHNRFYAVDPRFRGETVVVSYDPFSSGEEVRLLSLQGVFLGVARRYDRQQGVHPESPPALPQTPLDHEYLKLLDQEHRQHQQEHAERGVDYHQAQRRHLLSFPALTALFAKLLGRQGGASGLSTQEIEILSHVHERLPRITRSLVEEAFGRAEVKTIPVVVLHLQQLLNERNR
jgi:transposase InsO family protein